MKTHFFRCFVQLFSGDTLKRMHEKPRPQLRLEPCALGRHDLPRIGDGHELVYRRREHGKRHGTFTAVHAADEFVRTANAPTKSIRLLVRGSSIPARVRVGDLAERLRRDMTLDRAYRV